MDAIFFQIILIVVKFDLFTNLYYIIYLFVIIIISMIILDIIFFNLIFIKFYSIIICLNYQFNR